MAKKISKKEKKTIEEGLRMMKVMLIVCMLLAITICLLSLVPSISAFEFDNTKAYNPIDRSITIKNTFLGLFPTGDVAKITPLTPHINYVIRGNDRLVAEFEVDAKEIYTEGFWDNMEFYNLKDNNREINREFTIKYVEKLEEIKTPQYKLECSDVEIKGNKTQDCKKVFEKDLITYNKVWKELDTKADLPKGIITIGIFTDVLPNDVVEFIPTWANTRLNEYSVWTDSLNVNLTLYYNWEDNDEEVNHNYNITPHEGTVVYNTTNCLIGTCGHFVPNNNAKLQPGNSSTNFGASKDISFNIWVRSYRKTNSQVMFERYDAGAVPAYKDNTQEYNDGLYFSSQYTGVGLGSGEAIATPLWVINQWYMITYVRNSSGWAWVYINGTAIDDGSSTMFNGNITTLFGSNHVNTSAASLWGEVDETSFWGRTLSAAEVQQLFNNGLGISYIPTVPPDNDYPSFINYGDNNGSLIKTGTALFNVTVPVTNGTVWLEINYTNYTASNATSDTIFNVSVEFNHNGTYPYKWHSWGNGSSHHYNVSATRSYTILDYDLIPPNIIISYPVNKTNISDSNAEINYSATDIGLGLSSCWWSNNSGRINTTITCGANITGQIWDEGRNVVRIYANDTDTNENSTAVEFNLDTSSPIITIAYPSGNNGLKSIPYNLSINFTATDTSGISSCWYYTNYNITNTTLASCNNATLQVYDRNFSAVIYIYVNDTLGQEIKSSSTWTIDGINNAQTNNLSTYETETENFILNVTYNSSIYSSITAKLNYNTTEYAGTKTTITDIIFSKSLNIPLLTTKEVIENRTFFWNVTLANATANYSYITGAFNQTTQPIVFQLCNLSFNNVTYINLSFKNENNASTLSAKITSSNFTYGISGGTSKRSIIFSNNSANANYPFCFAPEYKNIELDYTVYYSRDGYPQRIFNEVANFTNATTQKVLNMLSSSDGVVVSFQVINSAEQPLENVFVNVTRDIGGVPTLITSGTTGADGGISFWLDANYQHTFSFDKAGYTVYTTSIFPSQTSYTITLGGASAVNQTDYSIGISYAIKPGGIELVNNTNYEFNLTLASNYWEVTSFGFTLTNSSGAILGSTSAATNGGFISAIINTNNLTEIRMNYYWVIDGNYNNATRIWIVYDSSGDGWSIANFFSDLTTYISAGSLFGLDNFGITLIVFIVMFLFVGYLSYNYGLTSPAAVSAVIFFVVFFFDIGVGILPSVLGERYAHFITIFAAIVMVGIIAREATQ